MKLKLGLVVGLGVGYVLGARGGREQYETLKAQAQQLWQRPQVQEAVDAAGQAASDAAKQASAAGQQLVQRNSSDSEHA